MPNKVEEIIEPISEKEQEEILARHHEIVDKMNVTLNGALKYDDENIIKRLKDPKEVSLYRNSCKIVRENQLRMQKIKELEKRFGPSQVDDNPMSRTIAYSMKLDDSVASKRYNEKIYQDYITNPNRVLYHEFKKIFNFNPQELYDCGEDNNKLMEFYQKHISLCENGFNIVLAISASGADQKIIDGLKSMKKLVEGLNDPANATKRAAGIDYFAVPNITQDQALALVYGGNEVMRDPSEVLILNMNNKLPKEEDFCTAHEMLDRFKRIGVNINDKNFYIKYKAVETDPVTHQKTQVSFDKYFKQQLRENNNVIGPRVELELRSKAELFEFKCITSEVKREYCKEFERRMAREVGQERYNVLEIEDRNKGGIWERYIRHSTSREYKEFIAALKDYNNPESPNYLNKDNLKGKANAYLVHKADQGYESLDDMKGTSLSRSTLAMNVIKVIDTMKNEEDEILESIEQNIVGSYKENASTLIKAEEVNIEGAKNDIQKEKVVEKAKEAEEIDENEISTKTVK